MCLPAKRLKSAGHEFRNANGMYQGLPSDKMSTDLKEATKGMTYARNVNG